MGDSHRVYTCAIMALMISGDQYTQSAGGKTADRGATTLQACIRKSRGLFGPTWSRAEFCKQIAVNLLSVYCFSTQYHQICLYLVHSIACSHVTKTTGKSADACVHNRVQG